MKRHVRKLLGGKPEPKSDLVVDTVPAQVREDQRIRDRYKVKIVNKGGSSWPYHVYVTRFGFRVFHDYEGTEAGAIRDAKEFLDGKVRSKKTTPKNIRTVRGSKL